MQFFCPSQRLALASRYGVTYHFFSQFETDLAFPGRGVDPACTSARFLTDYEMFEHTLKLGLSSDGITVDLITTSDHTVQRLSVVSKNHIFPQRVITRFVLSLELVRVDTGRET